MMLQAPRSLAAQFNTFSQIECNAIRGHLFPNGVVNTSFAPDTLAKLRGCPGSWGSGLARFMREYTLATDTARYLIVFDMARGWREYSIFLNAIDVANNASAPTYIRNAALIVLIDFETTYGSGFDARMFLNYSGPSTGCGTSKAGDSDHVWNGEYALPQDHECRTLVLANSLIASGAPASVKFLASCLEELTRVPLAQPGYDEEDEFDYEADIEVVTVCYGHYKIRNKSRAWVPVYIGRFGWHAETDGEPGFQFTLPPRADNASYSETSVDTDDPRYPGIMVYGPYPFDGVQIAYTRGHPCDP